MNDSDSARTLVLEGDASKITNHGSSYPILTRLLLDLEYLHQSQSLYGSVDSILMHLCTGQCLQDTVIICSAYKTTRVYCQIMQDYKVPPVMANSAAVN